MDKKITEKKRRRKIRKGFISHIPTTIDELSIALLQPNYKRTGSGTEEKTEIREKKDGINNYFDH